MVFKDQFFLVKGLLTSLYKDFLSNGFIKSFLKNLVNVAVGDKPIVFEIFTNSWDEDDSLTKLSEIINDKTMVAKNNIKRAVKNVLGERGISNIKKIINK